MKKLIFLLAFEAGCASDSKCVDDQVELYGDLCAESSSGYQYMNPRDAHFEGVSCAVESIKICRGEE